MKASLLSAGQENIVYLIFGLISLNPVPELSGLSKVTYPPCDKVIVHKHESQTR